MLETLNKYIEDPDAGNWISSSLLSQYVKDSRFKKILVISVIGHIIFYATMIELNVIAMRRKPARAQTQATLTKITDIAPPAERFNLRPPPEPVVRADLNHLQY